MTCFITKATPVHRKQLVVQVQYHVNVIYSLGDRHTHMHTYTDIPTLRTKAISRNHTSPVLYRQSNFNCKWTNSYKAVLRIMVGCQTFSDKTCLVLIGQNVQPIIIIMV